jgi:uncharacterized membrane protein
MNQIWIGIALFFGAHLLPLTPLKPAIKGLLGEGPYKGLFSLASFAGLGLIVWGFLLTRAGPEDSNLFYEPADWTRHVTMLFVLLGFISLSASFHKGRLGLWLRHPMSVGFAFWTAGHLLANGQKTLVYIFGAFFIYAIVDIIFGKPKTYVPKPKHDIIAPLVGLLLYAIFLFGFHPWVLNLPVAG